MGRYVLVGYSNAVEGREDEYNDWYWNHHFKDILALPGVTSGRRFTPANAQLGDLTPSFKYLGMFEVECEHPQDFFRDLGERVASGTMSRSTSVAEGSSLVLWQLMTEGAAA